MIHDQTADTVDLVVSEVVIFEVDLPKVRALRHRGEAEQIVVRQVEVLQRRPRRVVDKTLCAGDNTGVPITVEMLLVY